MESTAPALPYPQALPHSPASPRRITRVPLPATRQRHEGTHELDLSAMSASSPGVLFTGNNVCQQVSHYNIYI